jgi:REP element-mobilizing transposase RayT
MSELRKANYDALFFVTLTVAGWVDVFSRRQYADIVIGALQYCQAYKGLGIYGYVLMTNHLHLLAAQQQGELNKVLGHFKSYTGKEILRSIEEQPESRREWMLMVFRTMQGISRITKPIISGRKPTMPLIVIPGSWLYRS